MGYRLAGLVNLTDNTNINYLRNSRYTRLSPYLSQSKNRHKCPSDTYLSAVQRARGWKERVRSYSMNLTIGGGNALTGPFDAIYKQCRTVQDLVLPSPDETTVFLDEHPDSINDPGLFPPRSAGFIDGPGNLHNGSGTIAFADSHVETHSWKGRLRRARVGGLSWVSPPGDPDVSWLSYHSQRHGPETF
jgi:prepilin-type processing-associated H-X9-DG protein